GCGRLSMIGVATSPGQMHVARMPLRHSSALSVPVRETTPYFDAEYATPATGETITPEIDETLITRPPCCSRMVGRTARVQLKIPVKLVSTISRQDSLFVSAHVRSGVFVPAQFARTSTRPNARMARSAQSLTAASFPTSTESARIRPPKV